MNDLVNGLFELFGGIFLSLHCWRLYKDKEIKGVSFFPFIFYTCWGYFNLFFYPSLNCWYSFYGGIIVVSVNTVYLVMLYYYWRCRDTKIVENNKRLDDIRYLCFQKGINPSYILMLDEKENGK